MTSVLTSENAPMVSLIIPVYNGITTLPDCIEAMSRQSYPGGMELIIVDDGSSDGSGDYAEKMGFKVIRQRNRGPGVARNIGAQQAKGEILIFADADVIFDQDCVAELVKPLVGSDIIGSQGVFYSKQTNIIARFIQMEIDERYDKQLRAEHIDWVATYAAAYRRDVFLRNGGFNDTYSSEDAELSFRLAGKGYKMVVAPKARCQHHNYENFFKFLRYKYKRAYWTIWLYRQYPNRILKDKLTPTSRKSMMAMVLLGVVFLVLAIWKSPFLYAALIAFILFFLSTLRFAVNVFEKDRLIAILSPFFLLARTCSYILGFAKGIIDYRRGIRTVKESAAK